MIKNFRWYLKKRWEYFVELRKLKRGIRLANERFKIEGKTFYVLKDYEGNYRAFKRTEIKKLIKFGILPKSLCISDLLKEAYYIKSNSLKRDDQYKFKKVKV